MRARRAAGSIGVAGTWIVLGLGLLSMMMSALPALAAEPLRVCLVSGSLEYKSNETLADFQKFLEGNYDAVCSRAFQQGSDDEHLPGLENLGRCDVVLLFTRRLRLSGDQLDRIKRYCQSGKPLVGVRTASHAIQTWLELDQEVLGGDYQGHFPEGSTTKIEFTPAGREHPILARFEPYESTGTLYKNPQIAADARVLLRGVTTDPADPSHSEPLAWTREFKGGRVFYTSLGHPTDFANDKFRLMLAQALFWTARRSLPVEE